MRRLEGPWRLLAIVAVVASSIGCQPSEEDRARQVEARIDGFLEAIRDGRGGWGWEHLRSDVKAAFPGGRDAWIAGIAAGDTSGLAWQVGEVDGDDFVGCGRVDFIGDRGLVPPTLYDDQLPAPARVATSLSSGPFVICATVGRFPWDAGIHGIG